MRDLDDKWRNTLASITELAGDTNGAPTLAHRATYLDSPDDSGLLTEEESAMQQQEEEEVDQENIPPSSPNYANNRRPGLRL